VTSPRGVAILGSTGSVGTTALRVLDRQRGGFRVRALTAFSNAPLLRAQAAAYDPSYVGMVQSSPDADPVEPRMATPRGDVTAVPESATG
jgi:1-deoxy-D-xylulose-5-phosphate reductoisomerase